MILWSPWINSVNKMKDFEMLKQVVYIVIIMQQKDSLDS